MAIHNAQIEKYGGETGVRDSGLLESALAAPRSGMDGEYFHAGVFDMAAAYLYHITLNHPFVDGNKRTGLACAILFLWGNGYKLECNRDDLINMVIDVAKGDLNKGEIAAFLQRRSRKRNE